MLIPRTALLGAIFYFPIMVNICVLTYAIRFEGTRIAPLMLLANLFLLVWDYDRLQHVLPFRPALDHHVDKASKFPVFFFGLVFAAILSVIVINHFLYDIRPGNSQEECTGGSPNNSRQQFCDCIYKQGNPLNACLDEYQKGKEADAVEKRQPQ